MGMLIISRTENLNSKEERLWHFYFIFSDCDRCGDVLGKLVKTT